MGASSSLLGSSKLLTMAFDPTFNSPTDFGYALGVERTSGTLDCVGAVSYTHLTLPTKRIV